MEEGRKNSGKVLFNRSGSEIFGVTRARPGAGRYSDGDVRTGRRSGHLQGVEAGGAVGVSRVQLLGSEGPRDGTESLACVVKMPKPLSTWELRRRRMGEA